LNFAVENIRLRKHLLCDDSAADWSKCAATKKMRIVTSSEGAPMGTPHGLFQHQGMTFSGAASGTTIVMEAVTAATLVLEANRQPWENGPPLKYGKYIKP
jgi:hypothetical protein